MQIDIFSQVIVPVIGGLGIFMLGLEFKIGSEVLRSVIVSGWNELGTLAAIILLRSLLTFLLHWEIDVEEKRQAEKKRLQCELETCCPTTAAALAAPDQPASPTTGKDV